jgi:hypothetical protein
MKRTLPAIVVAITLAAFVAGAGAQPSPGARRSGPGPQGRMYDPSTVETVAGEVVRVERGAGPGRGGGGVHVVLRTDTNVTLSVRLGPASYVDRQAMKIVSGDRIEVSGSRVMIEGQPVIVAAEVRKGEQRLPLRHDDGAPYWSGGRRRTPP